MTSAPSTTVAEALGCTPAVIAGALGERVLERCLSKAGLSESIIGTAGFYIPEIAINRFFDIAAQNAGDEHFGLILAEHLSVRDYGAWGDYVLEGTTLLAALQRAVRILRLHAADDTLEIRKGLSSTYFRYTFGERNTSGYQQTALAALGPLLSIPRHFLGSQWRPLSIGVDLNQTKSEARISDWIGTEVRSDRKSIYLEIAASDLLTVNPVCPVVCTTVGDVKRASRGGPPNDFVPCVEHFVLQRLGNQAVSLDNIADVMGTSRRTLQRKIDISGTSFRNICTDAKMRKATELLTESSATVSSIALQLDYSTASHFSRAFRKQFGTTPVAYRQLVSA